MSAKSERERRRQERVAAEQAAASSERRRLMLGYAVAGGLTLAVVVGLVIVFASGGSDEPQVGGKDIPDEAHIQVNSGFLHEVTPDGRTGTPPPALQQGDLEIAAREAGCELQLDLSDEGSNHITQQGEIPEYETDPPTSGDHNPEQLADGAYSEMPELWWAVHSLKHGRVEIQYSPDLPEQDQLALKGVFDQRPDGMLMFPNDEMDAAVAVTAWTQLMTCDSFEGDATLDAIRDFRDIYIGQGPEPVPLAVPD